MYFLFTTRDIAIAVLGLFIPPIAVLLQRGCGMDFCINLLLTITANAFGGRSMLWHGLWYLASRWRDAGLRFDYGRGDRGPSRLLLTAMPLHLLLL
ncbi:hypothetical protein SYNPS1DRAFT_19740 [Syncephalis pseudoplumigaleata]|uniref:Plasma membrane proteolipid 3 n=1 Tax=Syncephalis pseudoplumigaleata TaxID=1712513 RepID=A0A4P9YU21_9FUNG|nr:hypothetical protein SYNPS1DRAFT_19740 [Syncephalis pseudoplumigaleata]|eukprot:RKP22681.1 hypothetical protein SYNPS1DRAFT_19740 [Syncephalis pseudoplumigaleata]